MITSYRISLEKSSRYKQTEQIVRILELINMCKTIINDEYEFSKNVYGLSENGLIKTSDLIYKRVMKYSAIEKRLKKYYNSKLEKLTKF